MVTYDLDQAEQMDQVLHLNREGSIECLMSSDEFFKKADDATLSAIRQQKKAQEATAEVDDNDGQGTNSEGIIKKEQQEATAPSYGLVFKYFSYANNLLGGPMSFFAVIFLHILINVATASLSFYLAYRLSSFSVETTSSNQQDLATSLTYIVLVCLFTTFFGKVVSSMIFMSINRNLHSHCVEKLIKTKVQFFDENTAGVILNRMSSDIAVNDQIVFNFLEMIDYIIKCLFSLAFIVYSSPLTIIFVIFQMCYFYRLRRKVLISTRDCFNLIQLLKAPIISLIQDSMNGQVLLRGFKLQK